MTELLNITVYFLAFAICGLYLLSVYRKSEFGIVVAFSEMQFFLGACIYPILFFFDAIVPGYEGRQALERGVPDLGVAFHVLCICVGLYFGLIIGRKRRVSTSIYRFGQDISRNEGALFLFFVLFGIFFYVLYFSLIGIESALINAALVRQGLTEGLGENAKFLFLKNIAAFGLLAGAILPHILLGNNKYKKSYVSLYLILILLAYLNSISRTLLVSGIILPYLIYLKFKNGRLVKGPVTLSIISIFGFFAIFYGKSFGDYISVVASGGDAGIYAYETSHGFATGFMRNFEHNWFSIFAGINHFMQSGPYLGWDVIMSPWGFFPSRVMDAVGFSEFHYSLSEDKMSCSNTNYYGIYGCTIPAYYPAVSAYLLPFSGGIIIGFMRGYIFGALESMWLRFRGVSLSGVWVVRYAAGVVINIMTFVPATIAATVFYMLLLVLYVALKKVLMSQFSRNTVNS